MKGRWDVPNLLMVSAYVAFVVAVVITAWNVTVGSNVPDTPFYAAAMMTCITAVICVILWR